MNPNNPVTFTFDPNIIYESLPYLTARAFKLIIEFEVNGEKLEDLEEALELLGKLCADGSNWNRTRKVLKNNSAVFRLIKATNSEILFPNKYDGVRSRDSWNDQLSWIRNRLENKIKNLKNQQDEQSD